MVNDPPQRRMRSAGGRLTLRQCQPGRRRAFACARLAAGRTSRDPARRRGVRSFGNSRSPGATGVGCFTARRPADPCSPPAGTHTRGQRHKLESAGCANERQVQREAGAATGRENERAQERTCESQSRWRKMADGFVSDADPSGQTASVFLSLSQPRVLFDTQRGG